MRKILLLILMTLGLLVLGLKALAQNPTDVTARMRSNEIVYSGPGENGAYMEYVAAGRDVILAGRSRDSAWVQINIDGQVVGWVPTSSVSITSGRLLAVSVQGGLLDLGGGTYDVNDRALRGAEVELIRIQRPMRFIGARWFRLQAFSGASCLSLPVPPPPPSIALGGIPELERVQRELTFVQEQTTLAIQVYQQQCDAGGVINEELYNRGMMHLNNAYNSWDVVRKYLNELVGLEFTIQ